MSSKKEWKIKKGTIKKKNQMKKQSGDVVPLPVNGILQNRLDISVEQPQ